MDYPPLLVVTPAVEMTASPGAWSTSLRHGSFVKCDDAPAHGQLLRPRKMIVNVSWFMMVNTA